VPPRVSIVRDERMRWLIRRTRDVWRRLQNFSIACSLAPASAPSPHQSSATLPGASSTGSVPQGPRGGDVRDRAAGRSPPPRARRLLCGGERIGDHQRHRLSDMQHPVAGQRRPVHDAHRRALPVGHRQRARDVADPGRVHLASGQDDPHTGRGARPRHVDRPDGANGCGERTNQPTRASRVRNRR